MDNLRILVYGKHPEILEVVLRLINKEQNWLAKGCMDKQQLKVTFESFLPNIILFGGGVQEDEEYQLRSYFSDKQPNTKYIQHYGGGSGLLSAEIYQAIA